MFKVVAATKIFWFLSQQIIAEYLTYNISYLHIINATPNERKSKRF